MEIFEKIENARLKWFAVEMIEAFDNLTVQNILSEYLSIGFIMKQYLFN
jgi:hypothetical protein